MVTRAAAAGAKGVAASAKARAARAKIEPGRAKARAAAARSSNENFITRARRCGAAGEGGTGSREHGLGRSDLPVLEFPIKRGDVRCLGGRNGSPRPGAPLARSPTAVTVVLEFRVKYSAACSGE